MSEIKTKIVSTLNKFRNKGDSWQSQIKADRLLIRFKRAFEAFCQPIEVCGEKGTKCNLQYKRMTFYCDKCHHFTD